MYQINLYSPDLYNKQAVGLKRKDELRFDGYGKITKQPYNFYKDFCARTPDSGYCLEFLLGKLRNLKGNESLINKLNNLHIKKIISPTEVVNGDELKVKQELKNLHLINEKGDIIGLNKLLITNGKDKLPSLDKPHVNMKISGGKFNATDFIIGNSVVIKKNVKIPGSVEAKNIEVYDAYVNTVKADTVDAYGKAKLGIVKAGLMRIHDKVQIVHAIVKGWTIAAGAAVINTLKTSYFKVFDNVYAGKVTAEKTIAFGSPTIGFLKTKYLEKFTKNINIKKDIIEKDYPMVTVQYAVPEKSKLNENKIFTNEKLSNLRLNIKNPVKDLHRQINLHKNVSNE